MLIPYQCIQKCGNVLIAASLSQLDSFNLEDGSQFSSWTFPTSKSKSPRISAAGDINSKLPAPDKNASAANVEQASKRPTKRRRTLNNRDDKDTARESTEIQGDKILGISVNPSQAPCFTILKSTNDGCHVIGVVGEDKSIIVFKHDGKGKFQHLSQRVMPKRPCSLAISADQSTIICADKFGDVYSLPLLISGYSSEEFKVDEASKLTSPSPRPSKTFVPAANDFTIHTARNRKALQNQMRMDQQVSKKPKPDFGLRLLLGHVSMLTDVVIVEPEGRSYIITSDRDEHIRISRGLPQTHVINGYCLGHKEFVSRLCVPVTKPNILISGGGDDEIYVWDWERGKLLHKVNLQFDDEKTMTEFMQTFNKSRMAGNSHEMHEPTKFAVSNIHHMSKRSGGSGDIIIVTCEGIPALFIYSLLHDFKLSHYQTLKLDGNPLDVVADSSTETMIVSIDCLHRPGLTTQLRTHQDVNVKPLHVVKILEQKWVTMPLNLDYNDKTETDFQEWMEDFGGSLNVLYTLENLRKRGAEE